MVLCEGAQFIAPFYCVLFVRYVKSIGRDQSGRDESRPYDDDAMYVIRHRM